ncbi:MAG: RtcB family protein [Candidatus Obscuribacterales bacterium]
MIDQNYEVLRVEDGKPIKMWTRGVPVEDQSKQQLINISRMPFIFRQVVVMPDVHYGIGATVGSVIPTVGAVIPAAVGVDIGCGMVAVRTSLSAEDMPESLAKLRSAIEKAVPVGQGDFGDDVPKHNEEAWFNILGTQFEDIKAKHPGVVTRRDPSAQLGTLGGGNHFIELCLDKEGRLWVMLHSGSRGIGNRIGTYFIELARQDMRKYFVNLPDIDLAYFPDGTEHFKDYVEAVEWAQSYAMHNRQAMLKQIVDAMRGQLPPFTLTDEVINCHHNYISREHHFDQDVIITRKGAVRARHGDMGIIPGSMGTRSYIVRGKGNKESFDSCSHGAGRKMSRNSAKAKYTLDDHIKATEGVECRKDSGVLDETPAAYKPIEDVMAAQSDLVEVVHELKQILCVKG